MENKNPSEKRKSAFMAAFALIGFGIGVLLYTLGYNADVMAAGLFIGAGIGLLIDIITWNKK